MPSEDDYGYGPTVVTGGNSSDPGISVAAAAIAAGRAAILALPTMLMHVPKR